MYDAYEALPILEKLPLQIESIAAYGNFTLNTEPLFDFNLSTSQLCLLII
jgi:hypothetical protein